ncbi:MAG: hypothetical protein ACI9IJ_001889 [Psychromonas sp.]
MIKPLSSNCVPGFPGDWPVNYSLLRFGLITFAGLDVYRLVVKIAKRFRIRKIEL